jgi:hypothetical protein
MKAILYIGVFYEILYPGFRGTLVTLPPYYKQKAFITQKNNSEVKFQRFVIK